MTFSTEFSSITTCLIVHLCLSEMGCLFVCPRCFLSQMVVCLFVPDGCVFVCLSQMGRLRRFCEMHSCPVGNVRAPRKQKIWTSLQSSARRRKQINVCFEESWKLKVLDWQKIIAQPISPRKYDWRYKFKIQTKAFRRKVVQTDWRVGGGIWRQRGLC